MLGLCIPFPFKSCFSHFLPLFFEKHLFPISLSQSLSMTYTCNIHALENSALSVNFQHLVSEFRNKIGCSEFSLFRQFVKGKDIFHIEVLLKFITTNKNGTLQGNFFFPSQKNREREQLYLEPDFILVQKGVYIERENACVSFLLWLIYLSRLY